MVKVESISGYILILLTEMISKIKGEHSLKKKVQLNSNLDLIVIFFVPKVEYFCYWENYAQENKNIFVDIVSTYRITMLSS